MPSLAMISESLLKSLLVVETENRLTKIQVESAKSLSRVNQGPLSSNQILLPSR